jgi:HPt (histidine-containing phosphotransfer) domain-containing protein
MNLKTKAGELELEEEEYLELIRLFIATALTDVKELEAALERGETERAVRSAHSLKGAAGNLLLNSMYEHARKIEIASREGTLEGIGRALASLKQELHDITEVVQCWIDE